MTAERIALSGLCNCMIFNAASSGIATINKAGTMAKYLATSLAIEKVVSARFQKYDVASRMVATILTSPSANARTKDKARELKDQILEELKNQKK